MFYLTAKAFDMQFSGFETHDNSPGWLFFSFFLVFFFIFLKAEMCKAGVDDTPAYDI